jgi:hypothetical protein
MKAGNVQKGAARAQRTKKKGIRGFGGDRKVISQQSSVIHQLEESRK